MYIHCYFIAMYKLILAGILLNNYFYKTLFTLTLLWKFGK